MNKILVLVAVVLMGAGSVLAQTRPAKQGSLPNSTPTLAERANQQSKAMAKQLNLSADQTSQISALQLQELSEMQSLRSKARDDRQMMIQGSQAIRDKFNAQYKAILTPDQYAKFQGTTAKVKNNRGTQKFN